MATDILIATENFGEKCVSPDGDYTFYHGVGGHAVIEPTDIDGDKYSIEVRPDTGDNVPLMYEDKCMQIFYRYSVKLAFETWKVEVNKDRLYAHNEETTDTIIIERRK